MAKESSEKYKTRHDVFDDFTNRTIYKLITQGCIEGLESPVSVGKESNIFSAKKKDGGRVIIKIYRLQVCDFNRMYEYIADDPRFQGLKKQRRKIIFAWCQREYRNLMIARDAGVRAPMPLTFSNNVLIMEFIGDEDVAPKLKDAIPKNKKDFFNKIIENMKKLYDAGFVHSDLSQFNILNYNETPVFIDFSHCTPTKNPNSREYLVRDVKNICNFFRKIGLKANEHKVLDKIKNQ